MKHSIFIVLALIVFGCNTNDNKTKENITLIEKYIRSVEEMDYKTMESLLDDNYFGYGPSYGDSIGKDQAIENWKDNVENLYEKIKYNSSRNTSETIPDGHNKGGRSHESKAVCRNHQDL